MGETPQDLDVRPASSVQSVISDQQMRMVLEVSRMLAIPTDLDLLLKRVTEICCALLECEISSIFLYDPRKNELWSKVVMRSEEIRVPTNVGIVGHAFTTNSIAYSQAPYGDPRFNPEPDKKSGYVTRSILACPMPDMDGKPLGVIEGLNKRGGRFTGDDGVLIHLLAEQAAVAIQRHRLQQQAIQNEALRHEMDLARQVQEAILPKSPPEVPGLNAVGWALPASMTGGDCFDMWKMPDGRLALLLADASGHGLAPALIVSQVRTLIRAMCNVDSDPHHLLGYANARLYEDLENGRFVTAFLAFVSSDGTITWSSAGHGSVLVRAIADQPLTLLVPPAMPLGIEDTWSADAPPPARIDPTGSMILVSDGIFESRNPEHNVFGVDRMIALLDARHESRPAELLSALREAVREWQRGESPHDDQTIVIVQRDG